MALLLDLVASPSVIALSSSAEFREKTCASVQYGCKLLTACDVGDKAANQTIVAGMQGARRLFKFLGWIKFLKSFEAADGERSSPLRRLLYAQALLGITVDCMRDCVTLEKLGLARLPGLRGWAFARLNEAIDAVLASVGIAVTLLKLRAVLAEEQLTSLRVALFKSICHLGKAADAGKLGGGPGARIGALAGLLNSLLAARDVSKKLIEAKAKKKAK